MELTRRSFLAVTGASPLALAPGVCSGCAGCLVMSEGCLHESALGYIQCGGEAYTSIASMAQAASDARATTLVVPVSLLDRSIAPRLRDAAWRGASVLIELGMAFGDEAQRRTQRRLVSEAFDVHIGDVIHLWTDSRIRVPYVRYEWPVQAVVRDFSRAVPIDGAGWRVIASIETRPVAAHRRVGRGSLTMLGSPLGPALRAGDRDAATWFRSFVRGSV